MDFPRLVSLIAINTTPITHSWRFKQRQNILKTHSLHQIYSDIHSVKKSLCLEELLTFFSNKRKLLISQYYAFITETYYKFPRELHEKICNYIQIPIKFIK